MTSQRSSSWIEPLRGQKKNRLFRKWFHLGIRITLLLLLLLSCEGLRICLNHWVLPWKIQVNHNTVSQSLLFRSWKYMKKKKTQTLNPEKERFTSSEQGQCAVLAVIELRLRRRRKKNDVLEWCLAAEFSYSSSNSFLSEMTNQCLDFLLYAGVTCEFIFHRWQTT